MILCISRTEKEVTPLIGALEKFRKIIVKSPLTLKQRNREKRKSLRELGYMKYLKDAKVKSINLTGVYINGEGLVDSTKVPKKDKDKILHSAGFEDEICIATGNRLRTNGEEICKVLQFTEKHVKTIIEGLGEGTLAALYGNDGKFLGIGVLQNVDYVRKVAKILTPVPEKIAKIAVGKIRLDKNFREIPFDGEASENV